MAIERLYGTNWVPGNGFVNPGAATGSNAATWAGEVNVNSSPSGDWEFADPSGPLQAGVSHWFRMNVRKGSNSGVPTIDAYVMQGAVQVAQIVSNLAVTNTTFGQEVGGQVPSSLITNPADIRIRLVVAGAGGSPSNRNSVQVSHFWWDADVAAAAPPSVSAPFAVAAGYAGALSVPPATVPQLAGAFDVAAELTGSLSVPAVPVPQTQGPLGVEVGLSGGLAVPTPTVRQVGSSLTAEAGFGGALSVPTATVPQIGSAFSTAVGFGAEVTAPGAAVSALTASLPVAADLTGTATAPAASVTNLTGLFAVAAGFDGTVAAPGVVPVPALTATVPLETNLAAAVTVPDAAVSQVAAGFPVLVGFDGTLSAPSASVPAVSAALRLAVGLGGQVGVPVVAGAEGAPVRVHGGIKVVKVPVSAPQKVKVPAVCVGVQRTKGGA